MKHKTTMNKVMFIILCVILGCSCDRNVSDPCHAFNSWRSCHKHCDKLNRDSRVTWTVEKAEAQEGSQTLLHLDDGTKALLHFAIEVPVGTKLKKQAHYAPTEMQGKLYVYFAPY